MKRLGLTNLRIGLWLLLLCDLNVLDIENLEGIEVFVLNYRLLRGNRAHDLLSEAPCISSQIQISKVNILLCFSFAAVMRHWAFDICLFEILTALIQEKQLRFRSWQILTVSSFVY